MKGFSLVALIVLVDVATAIWQALVLWILWGWFMRPLGLPVLSFPTAIGVLLVASLLTTQYKYIPKDAKSQALAEMLAWNVYLPVYLLLFGFVVRFFL